jgi:hypothetical protein
MSPAAFGSGAFGSTVAAVDVDVGAEVDVVVVAPLDIDPADVAVGVAVLESLQAAIATRRTRSTRRRVTGRPYEEGGLSPVR